MGSEFIVSKWLQIALVSKLAVGVPDCGLLLYRVAKINIAIFACQSAE
jgi:hypothetical protein